MNKHSWAAVISGPTLLNLTPPKDQMSIRAQDDRLKRVSGCEMEFPNRWWHSHSSGRTVPYDDGKAVTCGKDKTRPANP
jgi:hypothetical protein